MLYYLDTNIVIYAVQTGTPEHQRALVHLAAVEQAGHRFAISELTWTETLIVPFQPGNGQLVQDFFRFFHGPNLRTLSLTTSMHTRASLSGLRTCTRRSRRLSQGDTAWPMPSTLPQRSSQAVTCF